MIEELGISYKMLLAILVVMYFIIKWAVKNGVIGAYKAITGKKTAEEMEALDSLKSLLDEKK